MSMEPDVTSPRRITRAGDYDLIRRMGSGGFGVVFEARHRQTGLLYAVKRIELSPEDAERFRNEALYPARIAAESAHVLGVHSFFHDPAESIPALPDLHPALTLGDASPDQAGFIVTHLTRGQNRLVAALRDARRVVEDAMA